MSSDTTSTEGGTRVPWNPEQNKIFEQLFEDRPDLWAPSQGVALHDDEKLKQLVLKLNHVQSGKTATRVNVKKKIDNMKVKRRQQQVSQR